MANASEKLTTGGTASTTSYSATNQPYSATTVQSAIDSLGKLHFRQNREPILSKRPLQLIAHRGFRNINVQNTYLAVTKCLQQGADAIEFDVQPSADGVLYLFHDATVNALTNGTGTFTALTSSYIDTLTYTESSGAYGNQPIAKLDDVLDYASETGAYCHVELKQYRTIADADLLINAVRSKGLIDQFVFYSFDQSVAIYMLDNHSDAKVSALLDNSLVNMQSLIDVIAPYNSRGNVMFNYNNVLLNPSVIDYARNRGIDVACYTVNSYDDLMSLMRLGVRYIVSDLNVVGAY